MTYGTRQLKNGKRTGYLIFDSGKKIFLSHEERQDFDDKIQYYLVCERYKIQESQGKTKVVANYDGT